MSPTNELYAPLVHAYDHFNNALFAGVLPPVIFTLQRKKNVMGFFAAKRWGNISGQTCNEIAINPSYFASSRMIEVMQTMVHEMVHAWQYHCGTPSEGHYHNKEWAQKMIEVGLMPSDTGEPGGAIVGRNMSDFIIKQGKFMGAVNTLLHTPDFTMNWVDRLALPKLHEPIIAEVNGLKDRNYLSIDDTAKLMLSVVEPQFLSDHINDTYTEVAPSVSDSQPSSFFLQEVPKRQTRSRHVCPSCGVKVYGKASLNIICADCQTHFVIK